MPKPLKKYADDISCHSYSETPPLNSNDSLNVKTCNHPNCDKNFPCTTYQHYSYIQYLEMYTQNLNNVYTIGEIVDNHKNVNITYSSIC